MTDTDHLRDQITAAHIERDQATNEATNLRERYAALQRQHDLWKQAAEERLHDLAQSRGETRSLRDQLDRANTERQRLAEELSAEVHAHREARVNVARYRDGWVAPLAEVTAEALAEARQTIAHRGTGYVPAWEALDGWERELSTVEAGHWLAAIRNTLDAAAARPDAGGRLMRALSLTRPWPALILRCQKQIENRTWDTRYRGPILLHAAKSWAALDFAEDVQMYFGRDLGVSAVPWHAGGHPTGIVGLADLVDVCAATVGRPEVLCNCGPWAMPGQHHWHLANPRPLAEPVPCRGALGLWVPPADVLAAVERQLAEAVKP